MRAKNHSAPLVIIAAGLCLVSTASFVGCGGGEENLFPSTTGTGGMGGMSGTGGGGGAGGGQLNCVVDGVLGPFEKCDDGNNIPGDGCENDCSFTCEKGTIKGDAFCDDKDPCNGVETCSDQHTCEAGPVPADGEPCGMGKICKGGVCGDDTCGDGFVSASEDCDDGNLDPNDGCNNCKFTCVSSDPTACTPADPCAGQGVCNDMTHTCSPGTPQPDGTSCGMGMTCKGGVCTLDTCGNGTVDPGEDCEPPNTPTCDANCKSITVTACGNGVRDAGEQCDDGNTTNLDGCDAACKFEQSQRVNYLKMQFATDAYCTANAMGGAVTGGTAQSQLQTSLDDGVLNGDINIMFKAMGIDDLTGTSDPQMSIGLVNGDPVIPMGVMYNGTNDLDWWYQSDMLSIDAMRNPKSLLAGSFASKVFNGGPGNMTLTVILSGSTASLFMSNVKMQATIGATSTPLASMNGTTPGHLASENLDPALVSFASMGQKTSNGAAKLCGNVSASSLAAVPIPTSLTGGGLTACSQNYSVNNTMLDLFIGGCTVFFIQQIKPTQPDQVDASMTQPGAGGPYTLQANSQRQVSTCKDKNGMVVNLADCLKAAAYSSFFKFASGRVILK